MSKDTLHTRRFLILGFMLFGLGGIVLSPSMAAADEECGRNAANHTAVTDVAAIVMKPGKWSELQMITANENNYFDPDRLENVYFYRAGTNSRFGVLLDNGEVEIERIAKSLGKRPAYCFLERQTRPWTERDQYEYLRLRLQYPNLLYESSSCTLNVSVMFEIDARAPFTALICTNGSQEEGPLTREMIQSIIGAYFDVYGLGEELPDQRKARLAREREAVRRRQIQSHPAIKTSDSTKKIPNVLH